MIKLYDTPREITGDIKVRKKLGFSSCCWQLSNMSTYSLEAELPKLPVPSLSSTSRQLLAALKPLVSPEEYGDLLNDSVEFIGNPHISLLQKYLENIYRLNPEISCYLTSINDETNPGIYGELKGDILPRNPYLIFEEDPYGKTLNPPNQCQRAANLINSSLKFIISLRNETLKPDFTPTNGNPLTMAGYKHLFGTTRVPKSKKEGFGFGHQVSIKHSASFNDSRHIVIICNNEFYKLEVITVEDKESEKTNHNIWFTDYELSNILSSIIDKSKAINDIDAINNSIGSITTQNYHYWKMGRLELLKSNGQNLDIIDDALFIVVLDHLNSPVSDQEKTEVISHGTSKLLHGTNIQVGSCTSRWYDKLQFIITANSVAGVVWESTSMDSTAILRFISDIFTDLILKLAKNINGSEYTLFDNNIKFVSGANQQAKPKELRLNFTKTPELQNLIHLSETRLADIINQHEYKTLNLKINSHLIKKNGVSIDSFLQICFQIANYTLYGKIANTLEPITTRKFRDARTELITVQNDLILKLVKSYITKSDLDEIWDLFVQCCDNHTRQYRDAMSGLGFERHFTSLIQILKNPKYIEYLNGLNESLGLGLPPLPDHATITHSVIPFLSNPLIEKIAKPELLISNCGNPALHLFGIPPAVDQGFGIGYIIHKDKIQITISSKHRQTTRFLDTFTAIVSDIKNIVRSKSNFLNNLADSDSRKLELQNVRIEKELSNINLNSPLTRHPIELTTTPLPSENVSKLSIAGANKDSGLFKVPKNYTYVADKMEVDDEEKFTKSRSSSLSSEYDVLGGYGYFDFGELDTREDEMSRNESFLNTKSNLASRTHSSTNLSSMNVLLHNKHHLQADIKHKTSLSERIRDRLSSELSINGLSAHESDSTSQSSFSTDDAGANSRPKNQIGRQLNMSSFS